MIDAQDLSQRAHPPFISPADVRVAGAALIAGVAFDLAVRSGIIAFAGTLAVIVAAGGVILTRDIRRAHALGPLGCAMALGVLLTVRHSPWILAPVLLALPPLLLVGASMATRGDLFDLRPGDALARAAHGTWRMLGAPAFLASARPERPPEDRGSGRAWAILRGALVAVPLVAVLGMLLASGDALFASAVSIDFDLGSIPSHIVLLAVGAWGFGGLAAIASSPPPTLDAPHVRLGSIELFVVLVSLVALFSLFVGVQMVALSDGGQRVLQTEGLTYAEYARSGFFQLVAAAAVTIGSLLALRPSISDAPSSQPALRALGLAVVALTLVVVLVAIRRLGFYADAYGLTMLRLACTAFAWWLGGVLVLVGVAFAGVGSGRAWLTGACGALAVAALLMWGLVDPEAMVVRTNIDHAAEAELDARYLAGLSADGIAPLVANLDELRPEQQAAVRQVLPCYHARDERSGWASWNASRSRGVAALRSVCGATPMANTPAG